MAWTLSFDRQRRYASMAMAAKAALTPRQIIELAATPSVGRMVATANIALAALIAAETIISTPLEASTALPVVAFAKSASATTAAIWQLPGGSAWLLALAITTSLSLLLLAARTGGAGRNDGAPAPVAVAADPSLGMRPDGTVADLMAQMSHDLRTPLNAIIGFSDIMHRELLGPLGSDRYHGYAAHIRESGVTLLKSVEDTLALTKLLAANERAGVGPQCLATALAEACREMQTSAAARRVSFQASEAGSEGRSLAVAAEPQALRQALVNLLAAGVELTPAGGALALTMSRDCHHVRLTMIPETVAPGVAGAATTTAPYHASLSIAIARTLMRLQQGDLIERLDAVGAPCWLSVTLPASGPAA